MTWTVGSPSVATHSRRDLVAGAEARTWVSRSTEQGWVWLGGTEGACGGRSQGQSRDHRMGSTSHPGEESRGRRGGPARAWAETWSRNTGRGTECPVSRTLPDGHGRAMGW